MSLTCTRQIGAMVNRVTVAERSAAEFLPTGVTLDPLNEARAHCRAALGAQWDADAMASLHAAERAIEAGNAATRAARKAAKETAPAPQEPAAREGKKYAAPLTGDSAKGAPSILARNAGEAARALKSRKRYVYQVLGDGDLEGTGEDIGTFGSLRRALEVAAGWGAKEWTLERVHVADMAAYDRDEVGMIDWQPIAVMEADD